MSHDKMKLAASYARKSTPDDMGLQQQHMINTERATLDGFEIPTDGHYRFSDDATSGARTSRRGLDALIGVVMSGEADFSRVYIKDVTREGRFDDPRHHIFLQVLFQQHGVLLCYADQDQQIDLSGGFDMSQMGLLVTDYVRSISASAERQSIRRRATDGGRAWASLGFYPNGNIPYATERFYADERTGEILGRVDESRRVMVKGQRYKLRFADDERRLVVIEIFQRLLDGQSLAVIAKALTARKIPSPGGKAVWGAEAVRRVGTNPIYAGHLEWGRSTRDEVALPPGETPIKGGTAPLLMRGFVPDPIVSDEMFDAVQVAMHGRKDDYRRRRRSAPAFLLSGLLKCRQCGGSWHGFTSSKKSSARKRRYYRHASPRSADTPVCAHDGRYLPAQPLDAAVTELLDGLLTRSRLETAVREALHHMASESGLADVQRDLTTIRREEASMFERVRRLVDDRAAAASQCEREACQAQIDLYNRRSTDLAARKEALESQSRHLERLDSAVNALPGRALQLADRFRQADPKARQAVCQSLIREIGVASETELEVVLTPLSA